MTPTAGGATSSGLPSHDRFPALDGYRAIAAYMVVITHVGFATGVVTQGTFGSMLSRFDFGVTLFFCISGFLLYRPWVRAALGQGRRPRTGSYAVRRLARILPAYVVVLVVVVALVPNTRTDASAVGWPTFWLSHVTFTQAYFPGGQVRGLTQMWSLGVEMTFYLILPLIGAWALRRHAGDRERATRRQFWILGTLLVIGIAAAILRAVGGPGAPPVIGFWLPAYLDWFCAGMLLAVLRETEAAGIRTRVGDVVQRLAGDPMVPLGLAVAVFAVAMTPIAGPYTLAPSGVLGVLARHWLYLVAAFLLLIPGVIGVRAGGRWRTFLQTPTMAFLGQISYGVFLWHLLVLELAGLALEKWFGVGFFSYPLALLLPVVILGSTALGWLSWIAVERPAVAWSHRVTTAPRTPAPQTPPQTAAR